jgi:N-acetylmuramate 1-kinase
MNIQKTILPTPLSSWLSGWITNHRKGSAFKAELLAGDGSDRKFYRVSLRSESLILLSDPNWTSSKDYAPHQAYLESRGIPVPRFLAEDSKAGVALMEDLGDALLQGQIVASPDKKSVYLRRAIEVLGDLHGKTYPVPAALPCFSRRFDKEKYFQEMEFTWTHLVDGYLGIGPMTENERKMVGTFCEKIAAFQPQVFCHRDYHTRNILLHKETLYLIDFQDARMGSPHYDVASLLYDAYVPVTDADRATLLAHYKEVVGAYPLGDKINWDRFETELHAVAFQRVVKAAGSFASFFTRYSKKTHLPYLKPALDSALHLQSILGPLVAEWPVRTWANRAAEMPVN